MIIRTCNNNDVTKLTTMKNCSKEQNEYLKKMIDSNEVSLNNCYILEDNNKLLGRIVIFNDINHLGLFSIEDVSQKECDNFLQEVLQRANTNRISSVLYEDKPNYNIIHNSLLQKFDIVSTRDNVEILDLSSQVTYLTYVNLNDNNTSEMIDLMDKVLVGHLDRANNNDDTGLSTFNSLKESSNNEDSWFLAYDGKLLVGALVIQNHWEKELCLNYIGVLPEWRGNRYSDDLVKKAIDYAYHYKASKLFAETDLVNFPMHNCLLRNGFNSTQKLNFYVQKNRESA